jgi:hypothetical protein
LTFGLGGQRPPIRRTLQKPRRTSGNCPPIRRTLKKFKIIQGSPLCIVFWIFELKNYKNKSKNNTKGGPLDDFKFFKITQGFWFSQKVKLEDKLSNWRTKRTKWQIGGRPPDWRTFVLYGYVPRIQNYFSGPI